MSHMEELFTQIHEKLITTGDWERIMMTMIRKLNESGWTDDMRGVGKEKARNMKPLKLLSLSEEMQEYGSKTVPQHIKDEMLKVIRKVIEEYVDD